MTHAARTAHPRHGVVSKHRLTGQCPVVRVGNERWMDGARWWISVGKGMCCQEKGLRDNAGQEGMRWWGGNVGSAVTTDQPRPLLLAAHIHSPGISLLFLPASVHQIKCATWKMVHSAVATDTHSVTAEQAARVSHRNVLLCVSANVCMFVCAVGQWWLFHYKLVLTSRDRGCVECDEGAMGALSDSWRSKLPRVSSSFTYIDWTDGKMTVFFLTVYLCNIHSETDIHNSKILLYRFFNINKYANTSNKQITWQQQQSENKFHKSCISMCLSLHHRQYLCLCMLTSTTLFLLLQTSAERLLLWSSCKHPGNINESVWATVDWNANLLHLIWICTFFLDFFCQRINLKHCTGGLLCK